MRAPPRRFLSRDAAFDARGCTGKPEPAFQSAEISARSSLHGRGGPSRLDRPDSRFPARRTQCKQMGQRPNAAPLRERPSCFTVTASYYSLKRATRVLWKGAGTVSGRVNNG